MTLLLSRICEEGLRCAYALSTRGAASLAVDGGLLALVAALAVTAWRLWNAPSVERRDEACRS